MIELGKESSSASATPTTTHAPRMDATVSAPSTLPCSPRLLKVAAMSEALSRLTPAKTSALMLSGAGPSTTLKSVV